MVGEYTWIQLSLLSSQGILPRTERSAYAVHTFIWACLITFGLIINFFKTRKSHHMSAAGLLPAKGKDLENDVKTV
jgi:hypothetical protein